MDDSAGGGGRRAGCSPGFLFWIHHPHQIGVRHLTDSLFDSVGPKSGLRNIKTP